MSWPTVGINLRQARDAAAARQECAAFRNARVLILPYSVLFPRSCIPSAVSSPMVNELCQRKTMFVTSFICNYYLCCGRPAADAPTAASTASPATSSSSSGHGILVFLSALASAGWQPCSIMLLVIRHLALAAASHLARLVVYGKSFPSFCVFILG